MQWKQLLELTKWMPLRDIHAQLEPLSSRLFKIGDDQYCLGTPYSDRSPIVKPGGPFLSALLWSCGDGAALRAFDLLVEKDENLVVLPPLDLLLGRPENTYREILLSLRINGCMGISEGADYRIATDGLFVHQTIQSQVANYYFRNREISENETPYAIMWKLFKNDSQ